MSDDTGGGKTKYQFLIGYTAFLFIIFFVQAGIGIEALTGQAPLMSKVNCTKGILGEGYLSCAYGYFQRFTMFFNISTGVGLFNVAIIIPYTIFMFYLLFEWIGNLKIGI